MKINVLSMNMIYLDGRRIFPSRLNFDGYFNHTRDVFVCGDLVIKFDNTPNKIKKEEFGYLSYNQCRNELRVYRKFRKNEKRFFIEHQAHGYINDGRRKVYWVAEKRVEKNRSGFVLYNHPDFKEFEKICKRFSLDDCLNEYNTMITTENNICCFDYGV